MNGQTIEETGAARAEALPPPASSLWPPDLWRERATRFAQNAAKRLLTQRLKHMTGGLEAAHIMKFLEGCGMNAATVRLTKLGWNDRLKVIHGARWGLEDKEKIKLYPGLVIPFYEGEQVVKIKIRRPDGTNPQHMTVRGSSKIVSIYGTGEKIMVTMRELDAAMLWGRFRDMGWSFLATGSVSARSCKATHARLKEANALAIFIENSLPGAIQFLDYWRHEYPQAFQWPLPLSWNSKTLREAAQAGHDLGIWLEAADEYASEQVAPAPPTI